MQTLLKHFFLLLCLTFCLSLNATSDPTIAVHLLDYLAKDYGEAVKNGQILSQFEYEEQIEFAGTVLKVSKNAKDLRHNKEFISQVKSLYSMIEKKAAVSDVASMARSLQKKAIALANVQVAPRSIPNLKLGAKLFKVNCTSCHGVTGLGDGPAGKGLEPAPSNFQDAKLVWDSSAYKFYNTIRLGIPGTGMAAYSTLTDDEAWSLAFYVKSLGYKDVKPKLATENITLAELASYTDRRLAEKLDLEKQQARPVLAGLRSLKTLSAKAKAPVLAKAQKLIDESFVQATSGDWDKASSIALSAYLEGVEPVEAKIKANVPETLESLEKLMELYRAELEGSRSLAALENLKGQIDGFISEIHQKMAFTKMSPMVAFSAAFSIFLREGFEAILLIIILISVLKAMKQPEAIKWVHLGWVLAVILGGMFWVLSSFAIQMSGVGRELMEGAVALLAVAVLVYVGFWLHRYSNVKHWQAYLKSKIKEGLDKKSYLGLTLISFLAVFREAFEVVLFLRAIWFDLDVQGQSLAFMGILSSMGLLVILTFIMVKQSRKLPINWLFNICSWMIMVLAFILAGKGIHSLQEAGVIGISIISNFPRLSFIGVYPTGQTLLAQSLCLTAFLALLVLNAKQKS